MVTVMPVAFFSEYTIIAGELIRILWNKYHSTWFSNIWSLLSETCCCRSESRNGSLTGNGRSKGEYGIPIQSNLAKVIFS